MIHHVGLVTVTLTHTVTDTAPTPVTLGHSVDACSPFDYK